MIEVLVSDLGQVVLPFDWAPARAFLRNRCGWQKDRGESADPWRTLSEIHERLDFGAGGCTAEEFFEAYRRETGLDASYEEFCRAWSDVFTEDAATLDLIRRASVRQRILLSNTNAIHWEWILDHHRDFLSVFDRLLASQEIGAQKPSAAIYRKVEEFSGFPPEAHLMIDDLAENVEGARACGWDGIVHTDSASLERELHSRGLLG